MNPNTPHRLPLEQLEPADSAPGPSAASAEAAEPLGHAAVYAAAAPQRRSYARLKLAGAVAAAFLLVGLPTCLYVATLRSPRLFVPAPNPPPEAGGSAQRELWLKDVLAAQSALAAPHAWEPTAPGLGAPRSGQGDAGTPRRQPSGGRLGPGAGAPPLARRRVAPKGVPPPQPEDDTDPLYAALFGSASRYAQASARPASSGHVVPPSKPSAAAVQGNLLHVRLVDEVASQPVGAPVIATLSRAAQLGAASLPQGAELHGSVRGASAEGDRIFISFGLVRLASGATYEIAGEARDVRGRQGVVGRRHMDGRTAGSIGLASAGRIAQAAGRQVAGLVGSVLGAGIEAATEAGGNKARRLDRDEVVVVVSPGTRFDIYVTSMDDRCD